MILNINVIFYYLIIALSTIIIWKGNRTKHKTIYRIRVVFVSIIMFCIFNILFKDINYISIKEDSDFIDQMVNISGVFVGFIFAGISVLFSLIGINKLKNEFNYGFLDKVFHKSFLCIASSLMVLIIYFIINTAILTSDFLYKILIYSFAFSIFYIIWSLIDYFKLIFESKNLD